MRKEPSPEKLRNMVRSILPSRYRTSPKAEKATRKRSHRRSVRIDLRCEDLETTAADLLRDVHVGDIVSWRRSGDKLSHFMRWCEHLTEGMSVEEALGFVRGILPKSLIGDHAYSHWEWHLRPPYGQRLQRPLSRREEERRSAQSWRDSMSFRLRRALSVDPELHSRLNMRIKNGKAPDEARRLLRGIHDLEVFVQDIAPRSRSATTERRLLRDEMEALEKGGHAAALRFAA